jgi:hypothetical protein
MQEIHDPFDPQQRERLRGYLKALGTNRLGLRKSKTRLFPYNLSTAVFVHLMEDPVTGLPRVLGYRAVDRAGGLIDAASWALREESEAPVVWQEFSDRLLVIWKQSIRNGRGPHLFHFGERVREGLEKWEELSGEAGRLSFLWKTGSSCRTDFRRLLQEQFYLPVPGKLTLFALGWILGFVSPAEANSNTDVSVRPPESLLHEDFFPYLPQETWKQEEERREEGVRYVESLLDLQCRTWQWAGRHLESDFEQTQWWGDGVEDRDASAAPYLRFLEEERRLREEDILSLQESSPEERMERFRSMGPLTFEGATLDEEGRFLYSFRISPENALSKFREDDFLKLVPVGWRDLQSGFSVILARYNPGEDRVAVLSRQGRLALSNRLTYSLEEDLTDWNYPKLVHIVRTALSGGREHLVAKLLSGAWSMDREQQRRLWVQNWLRDYDPVQVLNPAQRDALELPFRKRLTLIEGPPGTGKTHLLGWIIVALMLQAQQSGEPLRIVVSALTHRAIDGVLQKVADLVNEHRIIDFSARVMKWGRWKGNLSDHADPEGISGSKGLQVQPLNSPEEIEQSRYLVLGSTGFGLYGIFGGDAETFPRVFDWIVFDEASQVTVPQALLSLVYGKGNFIFFGDDKQLPPVVLGNYGVSDRERSAPLAGSDWSRQVVSKPSHEAGRSILGLLLERYSLEHRVRLDRSYRMNEELCDFPSRMWYDGALHAAPGNAHSRLELRPVHSQDYAADERFSESELPDRILNPEKPVTLVLAEHRGHHQKSDLEAEIAAQLAYRLMGHYGLNPDRLAIVSPHRAQNNATANRLRELLGGSDAALPVIDTVERVQGAERDVIIFALTVSDPDRVMSDFLNNPNRFNVAITRARQKLIVIGSRAFFLTVPQNEEALRANRCFKEFLQFCRMRESLFVWGDK